MEKKIRTDVFRFATLRGAQTLSDEEKEKAFVFHPDLSSSDLYKDALTATNLRTYAQELTYTLQYASGNALKTAFPGLYAFSQWLSRKKNWCESQSLLLSKMSGVTALSSSQQEAVWEDLFYLGLTKQESGLRDTMIRLLVASHFVEQYAATATQDDKPHADYAILAGAKVVFPKELVKARPKQPVAPNLLKAARQVKEVAALQAKLDSLATYRQAVEELSALSRAYNATVIEARDAARAAYDTANASLIENARVLDETTGKSRLKDVGFPAFQFTPPSPWDEDFLSGRLSTATQTLVTDLQLTSYAQISDAISRLETEMANIGSGFSQLPAAAARTVVYNGEVVELSRVLPPRMGQVDFDRLYDYRLCAYTDLEDRNLYLTLQINLGSGRVSLDAVALTAVTENGTVIDIGSFTRTGSSGSVISYDLTPEEMQTLAKGTVLQVQGQLTLDSGNLLTLTATLQTGACTVGTAALVEDAGGNGDDTDTGAANPGNGAGGQVIGIRQLGVADYRKVVQEFKQYIPGEVSHIENILKGQYKERATRRLRRSEETDETATDRETENLSDVSSTQRNEMHSETSKVLAATKASFMNASAGFAKFGVTASVSGGSNSSTAQTDSAQQAISFAKDVTIKATERIVQKVSEKRSLKMIDEYEESNKHGFDNRGIRAANICSVYRWIDKVYSNQVVNYGRRLMYEAFIPEPARFLEKMAGGASGMTVMSRPSDPLDLIKSPDQITSANYQYYAALFNAEVPVFPGSQVVISKAFKSVATTYDALGECQAIDGNVEIPEGYKAVNAYGSAAFNYLRDGMEFSGYTLQVGNTNVVVRNVYHDDRSFNILVDDIEQSLGVAVKLTDVGSFACTVNVVCELTKRALEAWQNTVYRAITAAYKDQLEAYNEALDKARSGTLFNPLDARAIEMGELKKNCLQLMLTPFGHQLDTPGLVDTGGELVLNSALATHADKVRFFESAFEWELMDYIFYPYMWADREKWAGLFRKEDGDPLFRAFLQSGMARVILSVRPGFEEAVMHYLETGEIGQGSSQAIDDDGYLSLLAEKLPIEGVPEGEPWETILPTTLTVLEAQNVGIAGSILLPDAQGGGGSFAASNAALGQAAFDTVLDFLSQDMDTAAGVTASIRPGTVSPVIRVAFNALEDTGNTPVDMTVYDGVAATTNYLLTLTYPSAYGGQAIEITKPDGSKVSTTFLTTNGNKII